MRTGKSIAFFIMALCIIRPTTGFAGACSDDVKQALTNASWMLTMKFNHGRTDQYRVKTRVDPDGTMYVVRKKNETMKINCDGKQIIFDWKNEEDKRFTVSLGSDGVFAGSRSGKDKDAYPATLKKIK